MVILSSRHTIIGQPGLRITRPKSAAAPFSPLSLSPALWLDFSDITTLFTDSAGTVPVASDGDVIGYATDKSGLGNHATQATTANKPLYKTGIQNGKSIARFDGANDILSLAGLAYLPASLTIAVAITPTATSDGFAALLTATNQAGLFFRGSLRKFTWFETTAYTSTATLSNGTPYIFTAVFTTGRAYTFNTNGASDGSGTVGANVSRSFTGIGDDISSETLKADLSEILVFPSALSAANRALIETYLNSKWAVY